MLKRIIISSLATATLLAGASPALAVDPPLAIYRTTFYSDSSHQTEIGHTQLRYCTYDYETNGAIFRLVGSSSSYHDDELIGYCNEGNFEPIF
jgi:hypothetical protein